jgi:hypothetical protein
VTHPLKTRLNILNVKLEKALGRKGPRIPGDGDGDGIPNEGKKKGTGSMPGAGSPAKMTNMGTEKYPYNVKTSQKLPGKHEGNTHYVGGFKAPGNGTGDHDVAHNGLHYSFTGKSGTQNANGSKAYEYRNTDGGTDKRVWVNSKGHLQED